MCHLRTWLDSSTNHQAKMGWDNKA
jgi:hypothetical protein